MKPLGTNPASIALSSLFKAAVACRNRLYDLRGGHKPGRFTISVGGIHAGGTGKTPMALFIGRHLVKAGCEVAFLSRGYKRQSQGTIVVRPDEKASWENTGDEPCMLHNELPQTWLGVGGNRRLSASRIAPLLSSKGAFILDDGFQHRALHRDLDIVCLPPNPFDGKLIPEGYLREPLSGLSRAHVICLIGGENDSDTLKQSHLRLEKLFPGALVAQIRQTPGEWVSLKTGKHAQIPPLTKPSLICGIARPERFVDMVHAMGLSPRKKVLFDDHHVYSGKEIESVLGDGADGLLTTQKDACRLNTLKLVDRPDIWYLRLGFRFGREDTERALLSLIPR